jgi:hypothetical protein
VCENSQINSLVFNGRYVAIESNISIDVAVSVLRDVHQAFAVSVQYSQGLELPYRAAQQAVYEL